MGWIPIWPDFEIMEKVKMEITSELISGQTCRNYVHNIVSINGKLIYWFSIFLNGKLANSYGVSLIATENPNCNK